MNRPHIGRIFDDDWICMGVTRYEKGNRLRYHINSSSPIGRGKTPSEAYKQWKKAQEPLPPPPPPTRMVRDDAPADGVAPLNIAGLAWAFMVGFALAAAIITMAP